MAATDRQVLAICIGAAFVFWLILNLSGDYDIRREVELRYEVAPERVLAGQYPDRIDVQVSGQGWDLLWESLRPGALPVTVELGDSESLRLTQADLTQRIRRRLATGELTVTSMSFESITLLTTPLEGKRVPVVSRVAPTYRPGHLATAPPALTPDSITVSGSNDLLVDLTEWPTEALALEGIDADYAGPVPLAPPPAGLTLSHAEVDFALTVESVIQRSFAVSIRAVNAPADRAYRLVPEEVDLRVTLPQSAYDAIRATDFRLVADLSEMSNSTGRNTVPIALIGRPEAAVSVYFTPRAAEFYLLE